MSTSEQRKRLKAYYRRSDAVFAEWRGRGYQYLHTLDLFLQQPRSIVFAGVEGYLNHWTLIEGITAKTIRTYDSDGIQFLLQRSCSMLHEPELKLHWLMPTHTYLLRRQS